MSRIHATDKQSIRANQTGMVSIMVTMVLMIVISLIVLGFAQISRRDQREALDRQLSTQAFYAAESGVNDVRNLIQQRLNNGKTAEAKTSCQDTGVTNSYASLVGSSSNVLDPSTGLVKYTCLMVDPNPTTLVYSDVGPTSSIIPLQAANGGTISALQLTWQTKTGSATPTANCPASPTNAFGSRNSWRCGYGVMRIDLVPTSGTLTETGLMQNTMTSFVVPVTTGAAASIPFKADNSNTSYRLGTKCSNTACTLTINGGLGGTQYYMRVSSIYQDDSLSITGTGPAGTVHFVGSQTVIDATGKANDVLRRIQVHVSLQSQTKSQLPDYAIESTDSICKRFAAAGGYFKNEMPTDSSPDNPLCKP